MKQEPLLGRLSDTTIERLGGVGHRETKKLMLGR